LQSRLTQVNKPARRGPVDAAQTRHADRKVPSPAVNDSFQAVPRIVEFRTDPQFVRRAREIATIATMILLYCRGHHGTDGTQACEKCASLLVYASRRTERCVFGDAKPTCANCQVHCYTKEMRDRVRTVMRWAGPRMLLRHPILALRHKLDGLKPAPLLPDPKKGSSGSR
jgi:hypothetical protein